MYHAQEKTKLVPYADNPNNSDYFVTMDKERLLRMKEPESLAGAEEAGALSSLIARAARADKGAAPVERWNPAFCGDLDMEIRADGSWWYMGTPINRMPLVQLFSSVLRKDDDAKTYLVTPAEKVGIRVVDAHFLAVELAVTGEGDTQKLTFRTNVGDVVEAGPDHPLRFVEDEITGGMKPYLQVRGRLEALVTRSMTYELLALGEEIDVDGRAMLGVRSNRAIFPVMAMDRLEALSQ